ncbi:MAG: primosomal replication protein N [Hydrogenophilus thermoluteolus]
MGANRCRLTFDVTARDALRYTPAGLAVSEGEGWHRSMQCEVGRTREVDFRFHWVAMGEVATVMDALPMGAEVTVEGFFAARRKGGRQLQLHLTAVQWHQDEERKAQ